MVPHSETTTTAHSKKSNDSSSSSPPIAIDAIDLDGWVVSFSQKRHILLTPAVNEHFQIRLRVTSDAEDSAVDDWAIAFFNHINFMDVLNGRDYEVAANEVMVDEGLLISMQRFL